MFGKTIGSRKAALWTYFAAAQLLSGIVSYPVLAQAPIVPVVPPVPGVPRPGAVTGTVPVATLQLKFKTAPLDMILKDYSEKTKRTILQGPGVPANVQVNLESQAPLTLDEYLEAEEAIMGMYGIGIIKVGDKFLKVVPIAQVRKEPMGIQEKLPEEGQLKESDALVSQMVTLKHIDITEATKVITPLKHDYGQVFALERSNSILVTDSAATINRILQMLKFVDVPLEYQEEPIIFPIKFTKASTIKGKLEEIIADYQKEQQKSTVARPRESGAPGFQPATPVAPTIPGVIRPPLPQVVTGARTPDAAMAEIIEAAERGVIRGKVKIVADDRTNQLIIITRSENRKFFENMIKVLDVETAPDIVVKIIRLEYAEADNVASTLNTLIGQVDKTKQGVPGTPGTTPPGTPGATTPGATAPAAPDASIMLRDYVDRLERGSAAAQKDRVSKIGELNSQNIKILSDKRTNALIIMSSEADFRQIEELIKSMDVMLSQVLIEAVIVQIDLDDSMSSGIHWIQRALVAYDTKGDGSTAAKAAWAASAGGGRADTYTPTSLNSLGGWGQSAGLTTYFTHFGLNLDAIVKLVKTESRSHILSSPIVVTTDNTTAEISSTEEKYYLQGTVVDTGGVVRPNVAQKSVGLTLNVKPKINKTGNVVMEIKQEISDPGAPQEIAGQGSWPTTKKRAFNAQIAVHSGETIILGGLIRNSNTRSGSKVPVLGSIPLLGRLFSSRTEDGAKSEVVAFITPYVLDTPESIARESERRKNAMSMTGVWKQGWSDSKLADHASTEVDRSDTARKPKEDLAAVKPLVKQADPAPATKPAEEPKIEKAPAPVEEKAPAVEEKPAPAVEKPAPAAEKVEPPAQKVEPSAVAPAAAGAVKDPVADLDPELVKFIERQEKRYAETLKRIDKEVDKQVSEDTVVKPVEIK